MLQKPSTCSDCPLETRGRGYIPPVGPVSSPILFVGEAGGGEEAYHGEPFVGAAGAMLNRILARNHWDRSTFRIDNLCRCQPPNNWLEGAPYQWPAIQHCTAVHLAETLKEDQHVVLVTLGGLPLRSILGLTGKGIRVNDFHGTIQRDPSDRFWVVPTFHPSHLQRGATNLFGTVSFDLQVAQRVATQGRPSDPATVVCDPSVDWFQSWADQVCAAGAHDPDHLWLAVDLETPDKASGRDEGELSADDRSYTIVRVNVSVHPDEGITVPYQGPYVAILDRLLRLPCAHLYWNAEYDTPRLVAAGHVLGGDSWDFMWAWHHLQSDLPRGLGFVAPFYCLAAGTRVRLWDGKSRKISDLVTKREQVDLLGCDEHGRPVPVRIKEWFRAESSDQQWVAVHVENGLQPIYCTPEHRIWTKTGWRLAGDLGAGEEVTIPRPGHNSLIHGTLLGDGFVDKSGYLVFGHCTEQEDWLRAKAQLFHVGVTITPYTTKGGYKVGATGFRCGVRNVGKAWRRRFYDHDQAGAKKSFVPPPDEAALAVWYGDDGCLARNNKTYNPRISIAGFVNKEAVYQWFNRRYGTMNVSSYGKGTHGECVALIGKAAGVFFRHIAPWVHPAMQRKLPPYFRGTYNGWMDHAVFQTGRVEKVVGWTPSKWHRRRNIRYCVEVDHPTHRYFASGGLISNSNFGAWKHLSDSDPVYYAAIDGFQTYRVATGIARDLTDLGMWDCFARHTHALHKLALKPAQEIGVKIDRQKLEVFIEDLGVKQRRLLHAMQGMVPEEVRPLTPKGGLKTAPKEGVVHSKGTELKRDGSKKKEAPDPIKQDLYAQVARVVHRQETILAYRCTACHAIDLGSRHRCVGSTRRGVPSPDEGLAGSPTTSTLVYDTCVVDRWYWQEPFNPDSPQQILAYLTLKGHKPGKAKGTGNDSTDRETLQRLSKETKDPLYKAILDSRAVGKVRGTYGIGTLKRMDGEDRIHPVPTFKPSTHRLSYVNPNITNVITDRGGAENLAAGFRACVVATQEEPAWAVPGWEKRFQVRG